MKKTKIMVLVLSGLFLLGMVPNMSLNMNAKSETWTQSSTSHFENGESIGVKVENGELKLDFAPVFEWTDNGEAALNYFGNSVSTAGDVNGDGYDDVIVGAYQNDDAGSNAGKAYVYHGSGSGLSFSPDWSDNGEAADDEFGYSVATAGDVNGDGYDDVIVGAPYNTVLNYGEVYVYFGSSSGLSLSPDWSDQGESASDEFGTSVACAGDVNGDGYDDVIVGAPDSDDAGSDAGEVYVYYGSSSGLSNTPSWSDQGEAAFDYFGYSVGSAGDVNGDSYDDVIIGAIENDDAGNNAGKVYVYHGSSSGLSNLPPDWSANGEAANDTFGDSVASAGDINGDGFYDVIVSAPNNDDAGSNAGEIYVYCGSSTGLSSSPNWSSQGETAYDFFGNSVSTAGDVNCDGYDDLIVSATGNDEAGSSAGKVYLYLGSQFGLCSTPNWSTLGSTASDNFGTSVSNTGDIDGDGYDDFIVSAPLNDEYGINSGKIYVYQYNDELTFNLIERWSDVGEVAQDWFGCSVSNAGDVNGDGYDDVIVGAYINDDGGEKAGKAYVYHGSKNGLSQTPDWSEQGEAAYDEFGYSVAGAGDVNGDGYDDIIIGAHYNDGGGNGAGEAYVYHGSSNGLSSTPDWSDQGEDINDYYGCSVATAGDVNGDGYEDVFVGALWNDDGGDNAGEAYVYYGSASGLSLTPNWQDQGEAIDDLFGVSVACAGDVNGDNYDDVIIGASGAGKVYVYYGSASGLSYQWTAEKEAGGGTFGTSVSTAGDVNCDGYDDVIIGDSSNDDAGYKAGEAYVYYGSSSGLSSQLGWSDQGEEGNAYFGTSVSTAGDLDRDGYDEVIIGASGDDKAYVYCGSESGLSYTPCWLEQGEYNSWFGKSVSVAGDVNGDSYDDIIIGAMNHDVIGGDSDGKAYVYTYPDYLESGTFISEAFSITGEYSIDFRGIKWNPNVQPEGTSVKLQIGICNDGINWDFYGPDGTDNSYFTQPKGEDIPNTLKGKYWCYKVILETSVPTYTPIIDEVIITYAKYKVPTVQLYSPNGGEDLLKDEHHIITWSATGDLTSNPISIYYAESPGNIWIQVASNHANTGFYNWTIPSGETKTGLIKITVVDIYGNNVNDVSDITFAIDPPPPKSSDEVDKVTENIDKTQDEKSDDADKSDDELIENTQNSKNQKEGTSILSVIAISEGFIIIIIIIAFIIFKRKSKDKKKVDKK